MDRDVELCARLERGHEASHGWEAKRGAAMGRLGVLHHVAIDAEFSKGDVVDAAGREEKHIPVVIAHVEEQNLGVGSLFVVVVFAGDDEDLAMSNESGNGRC